MEAYKENVLNFAIAKFGDQPDYPWFKYPDYAVLRHQANNKWYALFMTVRKAVLGLKGHGYIDILNIKSDPMTILSLFDEDGFLPAYHMNRRNWITILLDGCVDTQKVFPLLERSFALTLAPKSSRFDIRHTWLVPANPGYYDLEKAFAANDVIDWKQSSNIQVGDIVYIYMAAPCSAILYKCEAVEVDIPYTYHDKNVTIKKIMKIKLLQKFDKDIYPLKLLKQYGVSAVRGPRYAPERLAALLAK